MELENIKKLFDATDKIYDIYNILFNLEMNGEKNGIEFKNRLNVLNEMIKLEDSLISVIYNDLEKYGDLNEYIKNNYGKNGCKKNEIIINRIILEIKKYVEQIKYKQAIQNNPCSFKERIEKGQIITNHINENIDSDINNITLSYLDNYANDCDSLLIKSYLIQFKYDNMFINSKIYNLLSNDVIYLTPDLLCEINGKICDINGITIETKAFLKNNIILDYINYYVNKLIDISDLDLIKIENMASTIIFKYYIKSCLNLINAEQKDSIFLQIKSKIPNSVSKNILLEAFNNDYNLNIKSLSLKVKNFKR